MEIKAKVKRRRLHAIKNIVMMSALLLPPYFSHCLFAEEAKPELARQEEDFEAVKAEWEAVREQQIQMIQEKEAQLETLKEELFAKRNLSQEPREAQEPAAFVPEADTVSEKLKLESSLLQKREEALAEREQSLARLEAALGQKQEALEARERELSAKVSSVEPDAKSQIALAEDMNELDRQKAAFQMEREKFFREMNRQKENFRKLQSAIDEKTPAVR